MPVQATQLMLKNNANHAANIPTNIGKKLELNGELKYHECNSRITSVILV